jgi:osmoprotectant transport system substrate-binding protein
MGRPRTVVPAVVVAFLAVAACSSGLSSRGGADEPVSGAITVGSFNFAESELLAEIYSQALEADGYRVERSYNLGPRELVVPALVNGLVDFVPEYAGTALQFLSAGREAPETDSAATSDALQRRGAHLTLGVLAPAPAQDANAFVVSRATADRYRLATLSDLATVGRTLVFGGPPECQSRPLCLDGLARVYGVTFGEVVELDAGGPLTHQALAGGGIDVALLFTTDPALGTPDLVELVDDRGLQPAENVTPIVHADVIDRWGPELVATVDAASAQLTTGELRALNAQVAAGDDDVAAVASRWLDRQGLT